MKSRQRATWSNCGVSWELLTRLFYTLTTCPLHSILLDFYHYRLRQALSNISLYIESLYCHSLIVSYHIDIIIVMNRINRTRTRTHTHARATPLDGGGVRLLDTSIYATHRQLWSFATRYSTSSYNITQHLARQGLDKVLFLCYTPLCRSIHKYQRHPYLNI